MKTLAYALIIILLGIIAFFQFKKYQRFHPPVQYQYIENPEIDHAYYDPAVVKTYTSNAVAIGSFARRMWRNHKIDVRYPNEKKAMAVWAAEKYNALIADTKVLEGKLLQSRILKEKGYTNEDIPSIEQLGISAALYEEQKNKRNQATFLFDYLKDRPLRIGNLGQDVMELQKLLNAKGFTTKVDGNFKSDTEAALKAFQESKKLFVSGRLDAVTLKHLLDL